MASGFKIHMGFDKGHMKLYLAKLENGIQQQQSEASPGLNFFYSGYDLPSDLLYFNLRAKVYSIYLLNKKKVKKGRDKQNR